MTDCCLSLCVGTAVVGVTILLLLLRKSRKSGHETPHPPDTVMLHQLGKKGVAAPSISPFAIKLETYLRMADIPYKNLFDRKMSSKGKIPWIEYNGEAVPDSTFCIEYLNTKFNVNLSSKLSANERATARAFVKMAEEELYWYLVLSRCIYDRNHTIFRKLGLGWVIQKILERKAKSGSWAHGIGRHTQQEVTHIVDKDLEALSTFIGDKTFLMGDDPCEEDCAVFGQLVQFVWQLPGSEGEQMLNEKYQNLKLYCQRMRHKYWPDWNERVLETD